MTLTNHKRELMRIFEEKAEYRERLFRRGYLLSGKRITRKDSYPFYGLWEEKKVGKYYLYVQEKQTSYVQSQGGVSVAIIGHAYNPFDGKCDENQLCLDLIEAYKEGLEAYFDKVSEITGMYVFALVDGDKVMACQDACAVTPCYFGKIKDNLCIVSHPQLLADLYHLKMDPKVKKLVTSRCYNIGNRHLPGNKTPYPEVKRLGGNCYMLYEGECSVNRFYPSKPHPEYTEPVDKEAAIHTIAQSIHKGIECVTKKWDRCAISLSGGTDSKTTLACANGLYDKLHFFSFNSKPQELIDAMGAKKILEQIGLEHEFYNIPENNEDIEDFEIMKKILMHNTSYFLNLPDHEIRKYCYLHDIDAYDIEMKSWASEIGRVFLERKYDMNLPKTLTERHCSIFQTRYFGHPLLLRWSDREYYRFLREVKMEKAPFNYEHPDLLFWEIRMGAWGSLVTSSQDFYHRVTMPMNNRKIIDMFFTLPREERKLDKMHEAIIEYMNPKILDAHVDIRNLYFKGYRIRMEKTYYWLRTKMYRKMK